MIRRADLSAGQSAAMGSGRAEAQALLRRFADAGAEPVEAPILLPSGTLLDLYGEDIRARAYTTADPLHGEQMLRPDFTVPVVQMHLDRGSEAAVYTYAGEVFRKQEEAEDRATEYLQAGIEIFGADAPAQADARVFTLIRDALGDIPAVPVMGDMGLLMAAVEGLATTAPRKAALMRHIWRPRRFRALMQRYCGRASVPAARTALLAAQDPMAGTEGLVGLRSHEEIAARIATLREDAIAAPISEGEAELLEAVLSLDHNAPTVLGSLRDISVDMPLLGSAIDRLEARLDALLAQGVDVEALRFEASHGRSTMEYYDGMVFAFTVPDHPEWPPLATGGRYDALTRVLGRARSGAKGMAAVGAVIRPELLAELRGESPC